MDVIQLDTIPEEVKTLKRAAGMEIYRFLKQKVHLHQDVEVAGNEILKLSQSSERNLFRPEEMVTGAIIHGIRLLTIRVKQSWKIRLDEVLFAKERLCSLAKLYGGNPRDVASRFSTLEARAGNGVATVGVTTVTAPSSLTPPILVISDSMFRLCKPSPLIYPISHSGERAEGIIHTLNVIKEINVKAIVLNHGLNHTREYGIPCPIMEQVFATLSSRFPKVPLYHFQPPSSPSVLNNPLYVFRLNNFCRMMIKVGFNPITHPQLVRAGYDREGFHYSPRGMREVTQYLINALN
jgi:hypothetical protein